MIKFYLKTLRSHWLVNSPGKKIVSGNLQAGRQWVRFIWGYYCRNKNIHMKDSKYAKKSG